MNCLFVISSLCLVTIIGYTQDSASNRLPETKLGKINIAVDTIIKKEFVELYRLTPKGFLNTENLSIQQLTMWDAATDQRVSGLHFSTTDPGSTYVSAQSYSAYIDADEVPSLIRFLDALEKVSLQTPQTYTEYIFNNRDLKWFAVYSQSSKGKSSWSFGVYLDKYYRRSLVHLKKEDLAPIRTRLIDALPALETKQLEPRQRTETNKS